MATAATRARRRALIAGGVLISGLSVLAGGTLVEGFRPDLQPERESVLVLEERFDDAAVRGRGWFDGIVAVEPGQDADAVFRWREGRSEPDTGGALRHSFPASERVRLRFRIRLDEGWIGSGQPYHPHLFYLLTDVDARTIGPARTHLTAYVEVNGLRPVMLLQDSLNIGQPGGPVAGCGGTIGQCYQTAAGLNNGRAWPAGSDVLVVGRWHQIDAEIRMNTPGLADGVLRLWVDGQLVIDQRSVLLRTTAHPTQRFNTLLIGAWMDRSPRAQSLRIDDLQVWSMSE